MPSSGRARRSRRDPRTSRLVRGLLVVRQMPDHGHRCHTHLKPDEIPAVPFVLVHCCFLLLLFAQHRPGARPRFARITFCARVLQKLALLARSDFDDICAMGAPIEPHVTTVFPARAHHSVERLDAGSGWAAAVFRQSYQANQFCAEHGCGNSGRRGPCCPRPCQLACAISS